MKLIIVGGSGFIGRNIVEQVSFGSHCFQQVAATYCGAGDFPTWSRGMGVEPIYLDLRNTVKIPQGFDAAIYVAGNANHATASDNPAVDLELNALSMLRFLDVFHGRLVYVSSGAVYYGLSGAVHPGLAVRPTFAYGISKLGTELYAVSARSRNRLTSVTNVRLFYAFGRYDKKRRLVPRVLSAALHSPSTPFTIHGTGKSYVDALDASFVARLLLQIAMRPDIQGVYDLCGGDNRTVLEFALKVARIVAPQMKMEVSHEQEEYPVNFFASPKPLFSALDVISPPPLEDGIEQTLKWLSDSKLAC